MQAETWRDIRSSYLITGNDAAAPAQYQVIVAILADLRSPQCITMQEMLVDKAGRENFDHVETIDAGHSAFHMKPVEVAHFLRKAAGETSLARSEL